MPVDNPRPDLPGERILIVGDTNAGKSTLGARLAETLDVPFVELDALYWLPGWQAREREEFRSLLREHLPGVGRWVAAGHYSSSADIHWRRADTIVWLDYPLLVTLPRLLQRTWRRWRRKELLWGTNYEHITDQLMIWDQNRSLISYSVRNHRRRRRGLESAMRSGELTAVFIRLRRPGETAAWFEQVRTAAGTIPTPETPERSHPSNA
jgi:adenylate kinase family enzyme